MEAGSLNVRTNERYKERQRDYKNLRKALCVGYANKLAERMVQHNGYRTIGFKPQLVQVLKLLYGSYYILNPSCCSYGHNNEFGQFDSTCCMTELQSLVQSCLITLYLIHEKRFIKALFGLC